MKYRQQKKSVKWHQLSWFLLLLLIPLSKFNFFFKKYYKLHLFICVRHGTRVEEDNSWESVLSCRVGHRDGTQVVRLACKHLYPQPSCCPQLLFIGHNHGICHVKRHAINCALFWWVLAHYKHMHNHHHKAQKNFTGPRIPLWAFLVNLPLCQANFPSLTMLSLF